MNPDFKQLYGKYYSKIYNYVYYRLLNHHDTEDVVSEIFCNALDKIDQFEGRNGAALSTWLFAIASNAVNSHFRISKKTSAVSLGDQEPAPQDDKTWEDRHCLHELLKTLDSRSREALALRYWGDLSYSEISNLMQVTEKNVSVILSRAIVKLRQLFKE